MALDLSSLRKAVASLKRSIQVVSRFVDEEEGGDHKEVLRAGVIQNFEFTYELCWKFMKRWLSENIGNSYVDGISRKELFRLSAENKLITNVKTWFEYHSKRNITSHVYDIDTAIDVYNTALSFVNDAMDFLRTLEKRND